MNTEHKDIYFCKTTSHVEKQF